MIREIQTSIHISPLKRFAAYLREQAELGNLKEQIRRERRELAELPPELLRDIGVTEAEALKESTRDYDDIPQRRLHTLFACR